jgi:hypothetical protein
MKYVETMYMNDIECDACSVGDQLKIKCDLFQQTSRLLARSLRQILKSVAIGAMVVFGTVCHHFTKPKKAVTGRYNGRQNTSIIPGMGVL